jgi:hypothetical protein
MADIPDEEFAGTRAALAPTLAATAAILPWLAKERPPRFPVEINQRWIAAARNLAAAWSARQGEDWGALRQAIFVLYGVALDTRDADCLALGEALASAADRLDAGAAPNHLLAALSATSECLTEATGLEHEAFPPRARHFTRRLLAAVEQTTDQQRSPLIDRLFAAEVSERLELMREALNTLPPDAVMIKGEALLIAEQAEQIELYGLMDLARQIAGGIDTAIDLEHTANRSAIAHALQRIDEAVAVIASPER